MFSFYHSFSIVERPPGGKKVAMRSKEARQKEAADLWARRKGWIFTGEPGLWGNSLGKDTREQVRARRAREEYKLYRGRFTRKLKEEVRRRDGYTCQLCGIPQTAAGHTLHVHHADYDKGNADPVNLVSLCKWCHARTNGNRVHWTALFQKQALNRPEEIGVQKTP